MISYNTCETFSLMARMDALAAQIVARAAPIHFGVAQSPAGPKAVYRLRYCVVIERGWAKPEDFPDGLEHDAYDDRAVQLGAWDGEVLAGTARLVLPAPGQPLPTEEAFGLEIGPAGQVVDVGRVCVAPAYRDAQHRVFWGLLSQAWIEWRVRGFTQACSILTASVARICRRCGLQVVTLGPPRSYWSEVRAPALIRAADSIHTIIKVMDRSQVEPGGATFQRQMKEIRA